MARRATSTRSALRGKVRAGLRSWQAILVTLGLLIAQAPMIAHLLIVRHVTCEHGELVESGGHTGREEAALADEDDGNSEHASPGGGAESEHEHCDALALRHLPSALRDVILPAQILEIAPRLTLGEGRESRPVPLLSLAPKSSPPVV